MCFRGVTERAVETSHGGMLLDLPPAGGAALRGVELRCLAGPADPLGVLARGGTLSFRMQSTRKSRLFSLLAVILPDLSDRDLLEAGGFVAGGRGGAEATAGVTAEVGPPNDGGR